MTDINFTLTPAQALALDLVCQDHHQWIEDAATERARVAIEEMKRHPKWMEAAMALMQAGGDATNAGEVLIKGHELGLFVKVADQTAPAAPGAGEV